MKSAEIMNASAVRFELDVDIDAPVEAVWRTMIERPDEWWAADLRCVAGSRVTLDARAGGQLVEVDDNDGESLLWFTVLSVQPQKSMNFGGALAPPWGGPCQTFLLVDLEAQGTGTKVRMTYSMHGHVDESSLPSMASGWRLLLDKGLKVAAERLHRGG